MSKDTKNKVIARLVSLCKVTLETVYLLYENENDYNTSTLIEEFSSLGAANEAESKNEDSYLVEQRYVCFRTSNGIMVARLPLEYLLPSLKVMSDDINAKVQALSKLGDDDLEALGIDLNTWNPW